MELSQDFFAAAYLVATMFFIFGLKGLASPKTAVMGNFSAIAGMVLAVAVTLINPEVKQFQWILIGLAPGALIGTILALRIQMTAMPQLVAILHSFVGLAAVLVAFGFYIEHQAAGHLDSVLLVEIAVGSFIGAITFTGSLIAFGKLQALLSSNPLMLTFVKSSVGLSLVRHATNFPSAQEPSSLFTPRREYPARNFSMFTVKSLR